MSGKYIFGEGGRSYSDFRADSLAFNIFKFGSIGLVLSSIYLTKVSENGCRDTNRSLIQSISDEILDDDRANWHWGS